MFRSMLQNATQEGRQLHPTQSPQFRGQTSGRNHFVVLEGAYGLLNFVLLQTKGILSRRSSVRFLPAKSSLEVVLYSPELLVLHQKVTVRRAYCSVVYTSPRREDPDNSVHLTDLALLCSLMSKIYEVLESLSPDLPGSGFCGAPTLMTGACAVLCSCIRSRRLALLPRSRNTMRFGPIDLHAHRPKQNTGAVVH